jgi:hypothetical protein
MMAKVRADREAARIKREAAEKQQAQERSAMQQHDKPCYQPSLGSSAKAVVGSARRKSAGRPVSAVRAVSVPAADGEDGAQMSSILLFFRYYYPEPFLVCADGIADWAVVQDPSKSTKPAAAAAAEVSKPAPVVVRLKPAPVVDPVAADHEYYQKSLPPRRPGVPRMATAVDGAVSLAKQKKAEVMRCSFRVLPILWVF